MYTIRGHDVSSPKNAGNTRTDRTGRAGPRPGTATEVLDVLIIGGGLAGLALAVALRNSQLRVTLIESQTPRAAAGVEHWDNRVYAISPGNARFLADIGIWQHLQPQCLQTHGRQQESRLAPVERMQVHGDRGGQIGFSAHDQSVGELAWIVESSVLQHELWENARRQPNLTLVCPARPQALNIAESPEEPAQLTLDDGRRLHARLIVAADGANSWTRQAAGINVVFQPYRQIGVVANFTTTLDHQQTAYQWFRHDGILAWLPLPGRRISIVWSTAQRHAEELLQLPADALAQRVAAAGKQTLGELQPLTPAAAFPLRLMRAPRCVAPRLALIGDAAHTIHPLSGHGINLGFKDAEALASTLQNAPEHIDCGDLQLLRAYERARREEVLALQTLTHALQRLFAPDLTPLSWLRNTGLNLVQGLPVLKNQLVRYALG